MQWFRGVFFLTGVLFFPIADIAQQPTSMLSARQLELAETELQQIKQLVSAGALPQSRLQDATAKVEDAKDEQILDRTLYSTVLIQDLSGEQAKEMTDAAERRLERQRARVNRYRKLLDEGVIARGEISSLEDELHFRETALALAQHRAELFEELAAAARREAILESAAASEIPLMTRFDGSGRFDESKDLKPLETAYFKRFSQPLPISADGETAVHKALGFDHRGRVDVAVNPTAPEGRWILQYLEAKKIPYFAFRAAVRGQATGAHIHIGPGSIRIRNAG